MPPPGLGSVWTLVVNISLDDVTDDGPFEIVPGTPTTDIANIVEAHGQHTRTGKGLSTLAPTHWLPSVISPHRITARRAILSSVTPELCTWHPFHSKGRASAPRTRVHFCARRPCEQLGAQEGKNKRIHTEALTLSPKAQRMFSTADCWEVVNEPLPYVGWNSGEKYGRRSGAAVRCGFFYGVLSHGSGGTGSQEAMLDRKGCNTNVHLSNHRSGKSFRQVRKYHRIYSEFHIICSAAPASATCPLTRMALRPHLQHTVARVSTEASLP